MGAEAAIAFAAASGIAQGAGGFAVANQAANPYQAAQNPMQAALNEQQGAVAQQQQLEQQQGQIALSEAGVAATQKADQAAQFQSSQALAYESSGVMLSGSPLRVLDYTRTQAQQEINAITAQGQAQADLSNRQAYITGAQGEAGILGAQSQFITAQAANKINAGSNAQALRAAALSAIDKGTTSLIANPQAATGIFGNKGSSGLGGGSNSVPPILQTPYGYLPTPRTP